MRLYHFSEDPAISRFEPRRAPSSDLEDELVWAISEEKQCMYFFPRDCPRACFWPGRHTTSEDRERWFGGVDARMIIAIESAWFDRLRAATIYRYEMPSDTFTGRAADSSGHFVSRDAVTPRRMETMTDLPAALVASRVELRITPALVELWQRVISSTLDFSGTRLRNAAGWTSVDWDAVPLGPAAVPRA